jgi:hypothetical protein
VYHPVTKRTRSIPVADESSSRDFREQQLDAIIGSAWPLYAWATGEVLLLTVLLLFTDGAKSGLVSLYYVIVAVSVLRCRPLLVGYITLLAMAGYIISWGFSRFAVAVFRIRYKEFLSCCLLA